MCMLIEEDVRTATRDVEGQLRQLATQSLVFLRQNYLSILYNRAAERNLRLRAIRRERTRV